MIEWFMGLTLNCQSLVILITVVVLGLITAIVFYGGQSKIDIHEERQKEQEELVDKMSRFETNK